MLNHVSECLLCDTKEGESQIFLKRPIRHGTADEFYVDVRLRRTLRTFVQRRDQPEVNDRRRVQIVRQLTNVRNEIPSILITHGTEPLLHAIVCGGKKPQDFAERKTSEYELLTDIVMQVIGQSLTFGLLAKQQTLANTLSRPGLFLVLRNVHTRTDVATIGPGRLALSLFRARDSTLFASRLHCEPLRAVSTGREVLQNESHDVRRSV